MRLCTRCHEHEILPGFSRCIACRDEVFLNRKKRIARVAAELGQRRLIGHGSSTALVLRLSDIPAIDIHLKQRTTKRREECDWSEFRRTLYSLVINQWYVLQFEDDHTRDLAAMWIGSSANVHAKMRKRGAGMGALFAQRLSNPWA